MRTFRTSCMAVFTACALAATGCSGGGGGGNPTAPSAPTGVQATPGDQQVTITWTSVSAATSYNIYWSTTAGAGLGGTKIAGATSPYVQTGLTNGTPYYYVVTAVNSVGESAASSQATAVPAVNPPPAAPTNVTATAADAQVTVAWSAVAGATSYNIYWSTTTGVTPGTGTQISNATSPYVHTGRSNGTPYYYVVTAVNANGESTASAQVSATPSAAPYIAAFVLTLQGGGVPPFGFLEQARVCSDSTCNSPIANATVRVNGGAALTYDATREQYTGLQTIAAGASVSVQVTIGANVYSASGAQFTTAPTVTAPAANAIWQAGSAHTISWSGGAPTTGASYVVGVMDSNGDFVFPVPGGGGGGGPAELAIGTTSENIPAGTLSAGNDKVFVGIGTAGIVSQASGGIPIPNAAAGSGLWLGIIAPLVPITVQSATPAAPTGVTATAGNTQVSIAWSAVSGATSYNIYWSTTPGVTTSNGTLISNVTSPHVHGGLTNGTTYYYVVTAVNANGESSASAQVNATPSPAPYIAAFVLTLQGGGIPPFGFLEQARVCSDSTCNSPIANATVRVNGGTALTYDPTRGQYTGTQAIAAGASVSVQVIIGATVYNASGTQFTTAPTVTAPAANAIWQAASPHTITWTGGAPTTGASYVVGVMDSNGDFVFPVPGGGGGGGGPAEVAIGTTSENIPAGTLSAGSDKVFVGIGTAGIVSQASGGIPIPNAAAGSGLWLGIVAPLVPITVQSATPAAPTGVTATAGDTEVTISWSAVSGATSYNIYWSTTPGVTPGNGTKITGATSPYIQTGLANGTPYYYVVTAVNANGESAASTEVNATPTVAPYITVMVLSTAGGVVPPFGFLEQAQVCTDNTCSTPITNATVTVNGGAALTYDSGRNQYAGTQVIAAGASVHVQVTIGADVYSVTATQFSTAPTISNPPAGGANWAANADHTIQWSGGTPTTGAEYAAGVMDGATGQFVFPASGGGGGGGGPASVPIGTTSLLVPANSLLPGSDKVLVGIGTTGIAGQSSGGITIPNTAGGSGLWLGLLAPFVSITVQ